MFSKTDLVDTFSEIGIALGLDDPRKPDATPWPRGRLSHMIRVLRAKDDLNTAYQRFVNDPDALNARKLAIQTGAYQEAVGCLELHGESNP